MIDSYKNHCKKYGEKDTTLDRIDVNGNYEPSNCRWATKKEQARNTRNTIYTPSGEALKDFYENNNINDNLSYHTFYERIRRGWTLEDAITKPLRVTK